MVEVNTFAPSHTGLVRDKNEDLIKDIAGGYVLVSVADGMDGEAGGEYAA